MLDKRHLSGQISLGMRTQNSGNGLFRLELDVEPTLAEVGQILNYFYYLQQKIYEFQLTSKLSNVASSYFSFDEIF